MLKTKTLLLSLFLLFFILPSMAQTKAEACEILKITAEQLNSECPMDDGDGIITTGFIYENNTFSLSFKLPIINSSAFTTFEGELKKAFFNDSNWAIIREWLVIAGAKLDFILTFKDNVKKTITFTSKELSSYSNSK